MIYFNNDDIVQIGTPPGNAPVGALRISGANAFRLLAAIIPELHEPDELAGLPEELPRAPKRTCRNCTARVPLREIGKKTRRTFACPARVLLMPAPASYTRENVAEIHLPGYVPLLRAAMSALVDAGARPAAAGEFTFRAFRNGRLSLGQAEAVERLISAGTADEKRLGLARLGDRASVRVHEWRDKLMHIAALLEAALDFSEEEVDADLAARLSAMTRELAEAAPGAPGAADGGGATGNAAPHIALVGRTNAGKSSLLNALLGSEASLVSPQLSTTRDSLRRSVRWDGTEIILSDNPGFDPEGGDRGDGGGARAAARAMERLGGEDIACWVIDASRELGPPDERFAEKLSGGVVVVLNKCDLPRCVTFDNAAALPERNAATVLARVEVSARTGQGIAALRTFLARLAAETSLSGARGGREGWELRSALECCRAAAEELGGAGRLELAADDVRRGVGAFSRALGEGYAEEALTRIFSQFCIGK